MRMNWVSIFGGAILSFMLGFNGIFIGDWLFWAIFIPYVIISNTIESVIRRSK